MVAHYDGLVLGRNNNVYPLEIKSIKKEDFEGLTEPPINYIYQVTAGLWLAKKGEQGHIPYNVKGDKAFIMFVSKQQVNLPLRTFIVRPHPVAVKTINNVVRELRAYSKTGVLPKRMCDSERSVMARKCGIKDVCFKMRED